MKWIWLTTVLLCLGGCAATKGPPPLRPAPCPAACNQLSPRGRWQFVHRITFSGQAMAADLLGVTVAEGDKLDCALLTLEGLTLFAATEKQGELRVTRALPPFDRPGFARGLMADVGTIFLHPATNSTSILCGQDGNGTAICRYQDRHGWTVDLVPLTGGCFMIRAQDPQNNASTTITGQECALQDNYRLARYLTLINNGPHPYTLNMTLIEASPDQTGTP